MAAFLEMLTDVLGLTVEALPWRALSVLLALISLSLAITCAVRLAAEGAIVAGDNRWFWFIAAGVMGAVSAIGATVDWFQGRKGLAVKFSAVSGAAALGMSAVWFLS